MERSSSLTYNNICEGIFCGRPNRFIAEVEIDGSLECCHVKNTGRCKEILLPGAKVYLNRSNNPNRATMYDLIAAWKGGCLINIDSQDAGPSSSRSERPGQAPNYVFKEYLLAGYYIDGITRIKSEVKHGGSRFDFYVEARNRKIFIEVKGVTLEKNDIALFPDAPTERGIKHVIELTKSIQDGYEAHVVFIIQMTGIHCFMPNYETHPEFGATLVAAYAAGVKVTAYDCMVTPDSLNIGNPVPVRLEP